MSDQPWHPYVQKLNAATEDLFSKLHKRWTNIGFKDDVRVYYYKQAEEHFMTLMTDMLEETDRRKTELCKAIDLLLQEVHSLSKELKSDPEIGDFTDVPLMDVQVILKNRVDVLKQNKQQRLKYWEELRTKEHQICKALGVESTVRNIGIPSYEELEKLKCYLEEQEADKIRLENTFNDMRRSIMSMMDELAYTPKHEFEIVVCENQENFVYTANNMVMLRELRDNFKEILAAAKEEAARKREELMALWKYLGAQEDVCQAFFDEYPGHSASDIHALNEEIKSCKQKRRENIAKYVKKVREELKELWDMCKFDEEQRQEFKGFYVSCYDESLLTLHDMEVERLRQYYKRNKKIYELLEERENMWQKGKELDQRGNDPDRLLNRGGKLLIEEKERKLIQKKLPQIEEQINIFVKQFESENKRPFTIYGMSCDQYFQRSAEDYVEMKETLKNQRLAKTKDKSLKKTPVMSTSRRTPATTASMLRPGHTSVKNKSDRSPLGNSAKRQRRMVQSEKTRPTVCTSRTRRSGRLPRRLLKVMNASQRSSKKTETANDTQTTIGSVAQYEQFQEHLEEREELRSSLLPEHVLKNARGRSKMRTPVKTPVKPLRKNIAVPTTPNRTPKSSHLREQSNSPRLASTTRLAAAPSKLPFFF